MCLGVIEEPHGGGLDPLGMSSHEKKVVTNIKSYYNPCVKLAGVLPESWGSKTKDGVDFGEFSLLYFHAQKFVRNISVSLIEQF
jgi:hypothetical protein